jgi:hypothetical protein
MKGQYKMKRSSINRIRLTLLGLIAIVLFGSVDLANGTMITVGPGAENDHETIQAGIDAAVDGDTVQVAPGQYVISEPITFLGKAIIVESKAGPEETTIRMGTPTDTNRACVIIFENNETAESILNGFTVTGGKGIYNPSVKATGGGGILFSASSGVINNCVIVQNSADAGGGVASSAGSLATVSNCTISENSVTIIGGGVYSVWGSSMNLINCTIRENTAIKSGGGVGCWLNASITMTDCIVTENSATGVILHEAGYGGGLNAGDGSEITLINCNFENNSAGIGGGGIMLGGIPCTITGCVISNNSAGWWAGGLGCEYEGMLLSLKNCVISHNTAEKGGGGVACALGATMTISNCTICDNSGGSTWGGGGVGCWQGTATVSNSIIWSNTSPKGREISVEDPGSTLTINYSDVAGGQAEVHVESVSILDWGGGNIDDVPHFTDPENNDYHLKSQAGRWNPDNLTWIQDDVTSPCVDAGDPMSPISWELFPNGGYVNMGAYGGTNKASKTYFDGPVCDTIVAGDINGDGKVNRADLEIMALHWTDEEPLPLP